LEAGVQPQLKNRTIADDVMKKQMKIADPARARGYFEAKMAFTTGPAELNHFLKAGAEINVVDVRDPDDYEEGHIPGAINLPRDKWNDLSCLRKDANNVVYCYDQTCHLSALACVVFASRGYPAMELEGGIDAWEAKKLEIQREPVRHFEEPVGRS
jgi:rhodanese-related sulfurtransferase